MPKFDIHPTLDDIFSPLKAKSGINIKPENKGKFNATKKATGKSTEQLTHSKNSTTKKRAIFAQNASKWHHADDGDQIVGPHDPSAIDFSTTYPLAKSKINSTLANPEDANPLSGLKPLRNQALDPGYIGPQEEMNKDPHLHQMMNDANKTNNVEAGPQNQVPKRKNPLGVAANGILGAASAIDALIPYGRIKKEQVVRPPHSFSQYPYGTGSQAIMEDGGAIPFNNDIAHQVSEDKAGAPRQYYHSDNDYYKEGGPLATNGWQFGGYEEITPSEFVDEDNTSNKLVAKYGYRMHQDPTRNTPTFEEGGELEQPPVTKLNTKQLTQYEAWRSKLPKALQYEGDYDLKGLWLSDPNTKPSSNMHFPDTYKLPNHPTFSNESRYFAPSNKDQAGHWQTTDSSDNYIPYNPKVKDTVIEKHMRNGGPMGMPGATGFMATKTAGAPSDSPLRKKKIQNKAKNGEYLDSFNDKMLLTAEYEDGGQPFIPNNRNQVPQRGGRRRPIMPLGGEVGGGETPPTGFNLRNKIASDNSGRDDAQFIDHINYVLATGKAMKGASTANYSPDQRALFNNAFAWKSQSSNVGRPTPQVIQSFYGRPVSEGNSVDVLRQKLSKIGYSPNSMYNNSPNLEVQATQGGQQTTPPVAGATASNTPATIKAGARPLSFANGGNVDESRIIPGPLKFHYGGDADAISDNPYAGPTVQFNGPSHEDGGIGISYGGKKVEVEGGETGVVDQEGDFNVMGNMVYPGTNTKFKALSKKIATQENSANRKMTSGQKLLDDANPDDAYDYLRFNSGKATTMGADMRLKRLAGAREKLAGVQKTILDTADNLGVDPDELSQGNYKKAKNGAKMGYADGGDLEGDPTKPSRSDRNNNPGNIKYGPYAKAHGATGQDKDGFAIFDSGDVGDLAMRSLLQSKGYNNMSVDKAISKWTAGKPYKYDLGPLSGKRVGDLSQDEFDKVVDTMRTGEGTRYGVQSPVNSSRAKVPITTPDVTSGTPTIKYDPSNPPADPFKGQYLQNDPGAPLGDIHGDDSQPIPSSTKYNKLDPTQLAGEAYAIATNKQIPVPSEKFTPTLLQPYSVSFQDRLNENRDTFNSMAKNLDYNPSALAALGGQKYAADNAVKGEEFRTNQAISQDITNKNVQILNEAQEQNLKFADTQMVRQAEARGKTRAVTQEALNSVSSKILQHNLENRRMQLYEPLFDYRMTDNNGDGKPDGMTYQGGPAALDFSGVRAFQGGSNGSQDPNARTTTYRDKDGNVKSTRETNRPMTDSELKAIELYQKQRKMYLPIAGQRQ